MAAGGLGVRRAAGGSPEQRARATWPVPDGSSDAYPRHLLLLPRRGRRDASRWRVDCSREEERFSRRKHDFSFPERAIQFCLERAGIAARDLDYVAFFEKPFVKFERILQTAVGDCAMVGERFPPGDDDWLLDKLWIKIAPSLDVRHSARSHSLLRAP